ncbi:MAG: hypothetical protein ABEI53_03005 [Candidatus Magasanikbacteria bacterium]
MNIFEKVKNLNLPEGEYVVVGSGVLGALGLREVNDIDILVSERLLKKFRNKEGWGEERKFEEDKLFLNKDGIDIFSQLSWEDYSTTREEAIETARIINGVPFLNIEETIKFKEALGREKDKKDIELLKSSEFTNF